MRQARHRFDSPWIRRFATLWGIVLLCATASTAAAQTTTLTSSQLEYNNKGVTLINNGEYDEALGYFQSSLAIGEANVTYLNIGRTYTRMGRCADAAAAFQNVETSPAVRSPSPEEIRKILENYREQLADKCSARIRIRCEDDRAEIRVNDAPAVQCPEIPVPVEPGSQTITVVSGPAERSFSVEAVSGEVVDLTIPRSTASQPAAGEPAAAAKTPVLRSVAWGTAIAGGAAIATGLILDQTAVSERYDALDRAAVSSDRTAYDQRLGDYRDIRNTNRAVFAAGGVLAASSVVFWILSSDSEADMAPTATVAPTASGASFSLRWRW